MYWEQVKEKKAVIKPQSNISWTAVMWQELIKVQVLFANILSMHWLHLPLAISPSFFVSLWEENWLPNKLYTLVLFQGSFSAWTLHILGTFFYFRFRSTTGTFFLLPKNSSHGMEDIFIPSLSTVLCMYSCVCVHTYIHSPHTLSHTHSNPLLNTDSPPNRERKGPEKLLGDSRHTLTHDLCGILDIFASQREIADSL